MSEQSNKKGRRPCGIIITTDTDMKVARPKNGTDFSLDELRSFVGGTIDIISVSERLYLVVNDDGLILGLPYNPAASFMYKGTIVGNVLLCPKHMIK